MTTVALHRGVVWFRAGAGRGLRARVNYARVYRDNVSRNMLIMNIFLRRLITFPLYYEGLVSHEREKLLPSSLVEKENTDPVTSCESDTRRGPASSPDLWRKKKRMRT